MTKRHFDGLTLVFLRISPFSLLHATRQINGCTVELFAVCKDLRDN